MSDEVVLAARSLLRALAEHVPVHLRRKQEQRLRCAVEKSTADQLRWAPSGPMLSSMKSPALMTSDEIHDELCALCEEPNEARRVALQAEKDKRRAAR